MRRYSLMLLFIFLIILISSFCLSAGQIEIKKDKAPDFTIRDISGKRIQLSKLIKNGPVIIDFWALWCVPCRKELPHLQDLYKKYKDKGLTVLAINEDDPSSEAKVKPFVKGKRFTFKTAIDKDKELWRKFKIASLPTLFLIDKQGNIVKIHTGYRPGDEKQLEIEIKQLLETDK